MPKKTNYAIEEEEPKRVYIYKIECIPNRKCYVGRTTNLPGRLWSHKQDLRRGKHNCDEMQKDFLLYGEKKFTFAILESGGYEIWDSEKWWMIVLRTFDPRYGYNYNDQHFRYGSSNEFYELRGLIIKGIEYGRKK